jgi:hypothetical protein
MLQAPSARTIVKTAHVLIKSVKAKLRTKISSASRASPLVLHMSCQCQEQRKYGVFFYWHRNCFSLGEVAASEMRRQMEQQVT